MRATELTRSHVRSELAMLGDTIATKGWAPLVYTRLDGYPFTADGDVLQAYEAGVVRVKLTEVRRMITGTVTPHAVPRPGSLRRAYHYPGWTGSTASGTWC
ncbi:hypothetical protein M2163_000581 [Streptomyces sp. SAI-135]|uniref:hypothetical protein n=1 Tax=unclassified Streptomyces TaxID=2593676 RepID=UPI002475B49A|nr:MULTISPECIES: hypothetical protein [unclassified Streptomyces]MDH6522913.1 hypothetical protein [Streptomyces sp. SAI-090]MDH6613473.1 hypothetical protein [Streptomyces sp. SAI-135]